ncbi:MAG: bifunctional diaminohydroxyphosphoribosylaminopyrimidine deaminase/5-amino-6-(5-phosphoribosylamino)uracil reductase RibD [Armatimonadetes bacterium]|nr:bifunctional diaminohydroxyphosphoribosylaminopyrimidine deaminase/5-amino-6-(5-phosphoribosylamino)uracil reductase RibD [Armatimonadota bacterium]
MKNGEVVGRGFHDYTGGPHAEVVALRDAKDKAKGATAYVTLEPCNHHGKTPPCTDALLEYGIAKVVIAVRDPNPRAAGGLEKLKQHSVEVVQGVCTREAAEANRQFLFAFTQGRPMVTVKAGMTLDGKVALPSGESQWITSEESRRDAMELRAKIGAVLVGRKTAELDRARLNVRGIDLQNQPLRVVLDPRKVLDPELPVFDDSAPTLHLTDFDGPLDVLERIRQEGRTGVLIEGGPTTTASFLKAGLVDELVLYVAPKVFGEGMAWCGAFGLSELASAPEFELIEVLPVGQDIKIRYRSRNLGAFLASYNL